MKIGILICVAVIGAVVASASEKQPRQAAATLKAFYTAYATNVADKDDPAVKQQLFNRYLTQSLVQKMRKVAEENGYNLLIRAQDFNSNAIATIAVTHIEGDWYAVGYLDTYEKVCVLIPVKMVESGGVFRLGDVRAAD